MYAKRINEQKIHALTRPFLVLDGRIFTNPSEQQLRAAGYKPLIERATEEKPPKVYSLYYEEDDERIYLCYRREDE